MGSKIIIEGETYEGKKFRPSDWPERISGNLMTVRKHRISYSPLLKPSYKEGKKCLLIDHELKNTNPALYDYILKFAKKNNLRICNEEEDD